jgi:cytoskeletal protein CcmA (bactofilin family)
MSDLVIARKNARVKFEHVDTTTLSINGDPVEGGSFVGNVTGNVTGNLTGNVTGDVTGDVIGNLTGNVTGDIVGEVTLAVQTLTATGNVTIAAGLLLLSHASTIIAATITAAPAPGQLLIIANTSASGTIAHTVTLPDGVTFDGTNDTATLNAPGEALVLVAVSVTRYLILLNIGSVGLSNP